PQSRPQHSSGRFQLNREGENLSIELSSPFGQTLVRAAQRQGEAAWLETAQHQRYTGPTLEAVLQDAIGIPVPVSRLPDWLTDRFQNVEERSADGHSIRARDAGWQIERNDSRWFLTWHQNPQRIEIRLVVDPTAQPAEQP
ncbi:MAG: outer membrane lipoprotein LolB, partial [Lautropia mirabilis]